MADASSGSIESRKDYESNPSGQYRFWNTELNSSEERLKNFKNDGAKIVERFKGGKRRQNENNNSKRDGSDFRLNLFHSNVTTLQSMLYGNLPKVDCRRRYSDPDDDVGRIASMILQRLLNNDVQDNGEEYESVLRAVLQDRLLPGLGCARIRYEVTTETTTETVGTVVDGVEVFEEQETEQILSEEAPIDYYHWRDVAWGWGRTFAELPWIGFRSYLTKDEIEARFGEEAANGCQYKNQSVATKEEDEIPDNANTDGPWMKAPVWEIWDKSKRQVVWVSPGYEQVLDTQDDPLELSGFFPCPPFFLANPTTSLYVPVADYILSQDLYNEIDVLQTRISIITEAVKVVGVYDASAEGIKRMFKEGTDNDLIPVDNWALFAEKGGISGQIDWVPVKDIVEALDKLRQLRDEQIGLLQQITGMSDIMRGQLSSGYEGVGQSNLKAKFGSIRVQAMQDTFAKFASDLLQLKAEVIGRHFDAETIAAYANLDSNIDARLNPDQVMEAIELIQQPEEAMIRVSVKPESIAMIDYAQMKEERTDYITAVATFMQSAAPLIENDPNAKPFILKLLQWTLAGFKGSQEIEGVIDAAIKATEEAAAQQQDKPDPEMQRVQMQMQVEEMKHKMKLAEQQDKFEKDMQLRQADHTADMERIQSEMQANIIEVQQKLQADLKEIMANMQADIQKEIATSAANAEQNMQRVRGEINKDMVNMGIEIEKSVQEAEIEKKKWFWQKSKEEKPNAEE